MDCLSEITSGERTIIGVRDYISCPNPESGLFINELPGMSLKAAAAITPEGVKSGAELFQNSIKLAAKMVFDEFALELSPYFDFANIIETRDLKIFSAISNPVSATERGIVIKRWRSEAARLFVENLYIKVNQAGTVTIKIIDGDETTTESVDLVQGINTVRLDYRAEEESIKIVFDQSAFETFDLSFASGSGCSSCGSGSGKNIYVTGWDGTKEISRTYGVGVKVHMRCYEENVLCSLLPKMYFLLWYKAGIVILREHIATDRLNHIAVFGKEKAKALLEEYEIMYQEKYKTLVTSSYNYLRTTKGDCVKCNNIRYAQVTP